jgi:hypothetical protein
MVGGSGDGGLSKTSSISSSTKGWATDSRGHDLRFYGRAAQGINCLKADVGFNTVSTPGVVRKLTTDFQ